MMKNWSGHGMGWDGVGWGCSVNGNVFDALEVKYLHIVDLDLIEGREGRGDVFI